MQGGADERAGVARDHQLLVGGDDVQGDAAAGRRDDRPAAGVRLPSRSAPSQPSRAAMRARISGAFSPMP
jgi:hypothetical protein